MTPNQVLAAIGKPDAGDDVAKQWQESMAAMPDAIPTFLQADQWKENARWCGFGPELDPVFDRTAARIAETPALLNLAWHCYWRTFIANTPPVDWPEPEQPLGDDAGVLYLLVAIAFVPLMREHHRRLGIPEAVTRETAQQPRCYCDDTYRPAHDGRPGINLGQLGWLRHYVRERYVRLGRLEFWLGPNPHGIHVYRHRATRDVVALAAEGTRFAQDGSIYREPAETGTDGWDAVWAEDENTVTGTVIAPDGRGTRQVVTLPAGDWECALRKGDTSLMLHIPSGGKMTPEACADSFRRAAEFFPKHFPSEPPKAVVCASWIFSNQLQEIFPETANLVQFQKQLYLFPTPSGPWDGLWFVFLVRGEITPDNAPRETRVQRGILDYLQAGNRWHCGAMFFLLDDLERFGSQTYLSDWPPKALQ